MRLQTDNEFQQKKIKDLNERYNVTKFTTSVRGGKAFVAEQKIRELKKRMLKIKEISDWSKSKITVKTIIKRSAYNMNKVISEKYGISPNDIETKSLSSKQFRTKFNFDSINKSKKIANRLNKYDKNNYSRKKKEQREPLILARMCLR